MNTEDGATFERVRTIIARTFKIQPQLVTPQSSAGQLPGWDSFGHLTLMMEVEKEFSLRFSTEKLNESKTASDICELVRQTKAR